MHGHTELSPVAVVDKPRQRPRQAPTPLTPWRRSAPSSSPSTRPWSPSSPTPDCGLRRPSPATGATHREAQCRTRTGDPFLTMDREDDKWRAAARSRADGLAANRLERRPRGVALYCSLCGPVGRALDGLSAGQHTSFVGSQRPAVGLQLRAHRRRRARTRAFGSVSPLAEAVVLSRQAALWGWCAWRGVRWGARRILARF
jgi:hypothetical protein